MVNKQERVEDIKEMISVMVRPERRVEVLKMAHLIGDGLITYCKSKHMTFEELLCIANIVSETLELSVELFEEKYVGN